ncbi:hypothetical protein [Xanthomonas citri]|uniref:hypothetical protein n=1 Tax=Xanthomonas citri TaxID=346 RepID=UPI0004A821E5|nr:hypothetical protein [Xanthomonas citri]QTK37298.1 hypothetical protein XcgCFBP7119R_12840 [Xanthomonas citri pv. glycines]
MSSTRCHPYHPQCGCATCSRHELSDERADVLADALHRSGDVLSEALGELTTEQLSLIAGHLAQGNDAGAAEILRSAISDYIASEIERRMDDVGTTKLETVQRMLTVYEVKPRTVPAQPWQVAA